MPPKAPESFQVVSRPGPGGARKGAGRKSGGANVKTREIADRAALEGITPLEVMLLTMREFVADAEEIQVAPTDKQDEVDTKRTKRRGLLLSAADVAKDAAPFIHPRLAAIEHTGAKGGPIQTENRIDFGKLTDEQLRALASIPV